MSIFPTAKRHLILNQEYYSLTYSLKACLTNNNNSKKKQGNNPYNQSFPCFLTYVLNLFLFFAVSQNAFSISGVSLGEFSSKVIGCFLASSSIFILIFILNRNYPAASLITRNPVFADGCHAVIS